MLKASSDLAGWWNLAELVQYELLITVTSALFALSTSFFGRTTMYVFIDFFFSKQKALLNPPLLQYLQEKWRVYPLLVWVFLTFQSTPCKLEIDEAFPVIETSIKIYSTRLRGWQTLELKKITIFDTQNCRSGQQLSVFLGENTINTLVISSLHSKCEKYCISLEKSRTYESNL